MAQIDSSSSSSCSFGRTSILGQQKAEPGPGLILLLPQAAVLTGSDAGNDGVDPASDFVIQNCQTSCST